MRIPRLAWTFAPALLLLTAPGSSAVAGNVKGTVRLPEALRSGRLHQGYWRLENGNVPVRTASKPGTIVVLDGISGTHPPPAKTVTVEIAGLDASPRVVVVGPGSVVEFKNVGKITHELSTPADTSLMPVERLNPGTFRHQRFNAPGGYVVRCSEYPHLAISVIVVESPYFAVVDDKGAFAIPGVPDTKATLKVWSQGHWVHEQAIDAASKADLSIRVDGSAKSEAKDEAKDESSEAKDADGASPPPTGAAAPAKAAH